MLHVSDQAERALAKADGVMLYGPRTGSRTRNHAIPANLPPGPLASLLGMRVVEVSSLRPGLSANVAGAIHGKAIRWQEYVETKSDVLAHFEGGEPALIARDKHHYLACWPDEQLLNGLMAFVAARAGLVTTQLPSTVRLRRRGNMIFAFNYGPETWDSPVSGDLLLGQQSLAPQEVSIWRVT